MSGRSLDSRAMYEIGAKAGVAAGLCYVGTKYILNSNPGTNVQGLNPYMADALVSGLANAAGNSVHYVFEQGFEDAGLDSGPTKMLLEPSLCGGSQVALNMYAPFGDNSAGKLMSFGKGAVLDFLATGVTPMLVGGFTSLKELSPTAK